MREVELGTEWPGIRIELDSELNPEWLTQAEVEVLDTILNPRRRDEWVKARLVAKRLALDEGLCASPRSCAIASKGKAPIVHIEGDPRVLHASLSHSERAYGAAISERPVGLDVQVVRRLDDRALRFFLNEVEIIRLREVAAPDVALIFWVAKEASFKCDPLANVYKDVTMKPTAFDSGRARFEFESPSGGGTIDLAIIEGEALLVARAVGTWS